MITVAVIGEREVQRALEERLSERVPQYVDRAIEAETFDVQSDARRYVPIGETQNLHNSIQPHPVVNHVGTVTAGMEYGPRQEFGWNGVDRLGRRIPTPAKLFMSRAAEDSRQRFPARLAEAVGAAAE